MEDTWRECELTKEDYALFFEVASSIHAVLDLNEMLGRILKVIRRAFCVEGASIAIHDSERQEFYFIRTIEQERNNSRNIEKLTFPDHLGVAGRVLREKEPIIIHDVSRDEHFFKGFDSETGFVTRSMICLPLQTRKELLGVLYVLNKIKGRFTDREARLLHILSGQLAMYIENARMYGELRQYVDSLEQENQVLRTEVRNRFNLQGIIGSSPVMDHVFHLLEKVIDTRTTVLIQGETGTGKELIARVIHYNGPLRDRPFVAENCGALSESLLESELFGHVKGAFTGAVATKKGLFELADGGTIFLDEISEMSVSMQVKLLRVLQEGQLRPVGGSRYINVSVRLIASTNRDLEKEVEGGRFRQDLLYRINVFPITLPPLRRRREDIVLLANHFLEKFCTRMQRPLVHLTPRTVELLTAFDWPGNVRELENEIERALTLAAGRREIGEEFLSEKVKLGYALNSSAYHI